MSMMSDDGTPSSCEADVNGTITQMILQTLSGEPSFGADVVAVGCPFCMAMMEDGVNARKGDRDVRVMDVAELLWQSAQK